MALWNNSDPAYTDLAWLNWADDQPPAPRRGVLRLDDLMHDLMKDDPADANDLNDFIARYGNDWALIDAAIVDHVRGKLERLPYEWSRIDAVVIDEPFWLAVGGGRDWSNPCLDLSSTRYALIEQMRKVLVDFASAVRAVSASTRFWVNFSEPEVQWMQQQICPIRLNDGYMDVISMDKYSASFATLRPYYDFLFATRPDSSQQMALVPGTFYATGINPSTAASWLQGFFDYAHSMNRSCDLPIGRTGVTRSRDGCRVWLVAGFWGGAETVSQGVDVQWIGMFDGTAAPILNTWSAQLR